MSHITDVILVTAIDDGSSGDYEDEHPTADKLNEHLRAHGQYGDLGLLKKVDQYVDGKAMQCDVFIAAVNYLDIDKFLAAFQAIKWEYPEHVQLMLKDENEDVFTVQRPAPYDRKERL